MTPTARGNADRRPIAAGVAAGLWLAWLAVDGAGIWLTGPWGWDDGAITLAFARTLGEHGRFALTPASETVEGSSSLLLVFLMAGLHRVAGFDFDGFVRASQGLALAATAASMGLVQHALRGAIDDGRERAIVAALYGTLPMFTAEILNGMEMALVAALMAGLLVAIRARAMAAALVLVPLLLLARFECAFLLGLAFGALALLQPQRRRFWLALLVAVVLAFGAIAAWRWQVFGAWLPNTVRAKTQPPYSGARLGDLLLRKGEGLAEFLGVHAALLLAGFGLIALRAPGAARVDAAGALVFAYAAFAAIAGRNWGYAGRMFVGCLPVLVVLAADTFRDAPVRGSVLAAALGGRRVELSSSRAAFVVLAGALLATHALNARLTLDNVRTAGYGGYHQDRLPARLQRFVAGHLPPPDDPYGWVTPAQFRITGMAIERLRGVLGLPVIRFMAPDVGGTTLCCPRIAMLDSAMLANRALARTGYAGLDRYIEQARPQVIETHGYWSVESGIYRSPFFAAHYVPVVFEDGLYWMARETAAALAASPAVEKRWEADIDGLVALRHAHDAVDRREVRRRQPDGVWRLRVRMNVSPG